ncbi:MAG: DUF167 domain-containing protein [Bacteroidetes bacterium]|nr:DUF167 domain-containing protein [Bacteroidota bacterium]
MKDLQKMIVLNIKVKPGSFKDEISIDNDGQWMIKIREKPIDGAANDYLVKFLVKEFKLRKSDIQIEKGLSSPFKKIALNVSEEKLSEIKKKYL